MKYYYLKRQHGVFYYVKNNHRTYGYRYTYYDDEHKRHEKKREGFSNVKEALANRDLVVHHNSILKQSHDLTFKQWAEQVIESKKDERITTYKSYSHLLNRSVIPYLGKYKLVDLTPAIYRKRCWEKLLKQGLSANSIKAINTRVQAVMNEAVKNGLLDKNPLKFSNISKYIERNARPRKPIMSHAQLEKFNQCLDKEPITLKAIYYTLERTGMRAGELLGLYWKNINLKDREVSIQHTRDAYGERRPKTKTSRRVIFIDRKLLKVLREYHAYCKKKFNITPDTHVILGMHGKPLIPRLVSADLKRLLILSGLKHLVGHFTPHSFRHQFASSLIVDHDVDVVRVSKILGHANPTITLKVYAQLSRHKPLDIGKILK